MILALLLMIVGILWIVGATGAAKRLAVFAVAAALAWSVVCFALCRLGRPLATGDGSGSDGLFWIVAALAGLALLGAASWHGRDRRRKRLEAFRKRNLHPRQRALPPPPADEAVG